MSEELSQTPAVVTPAAPSPAPVATPAPEPTPASQQLPPGLAERAAAAAQQAALPTAPKDATPPAEAGSLQAMIGAELAADPAAKTGIALLERICGDKVDLQRAFGRAMEEDDIRFVDQAYLREIIGDDTDLVLQTAEQLMRVAEAQGEALVRDLTKDIPGGEGALAQASTVFNAKADPATRAAMTRLLDSGDKQSMQYAVNQIMEFARSSGQLIVHHDPALGAPGSLQGLSKEDYAKAIQKRNLSDAEYTQLKAQRKLGIQQGL
jgi:hypothetical protein